MITLNIKPLTANRCWRGRRFKTTEYSDYERILFLLLPELKVPEGELKLTLEVGFSSRASDLDNVLKPFIDILQKAYGFNDKHIFEIHCRKTYVAKGNEYIKFLLEGIE